MAKLILTQEVSGLGAPGDVVDVKDGYARNYLIPRRLATPWTKGAAKQIEGIRRARRARAIASLDDARIVRDELQAKSVTITSKAGVNGRLFGTVTGADIAEAVKAVGGPTIDKRKVEIPTHIKNVGEYVVYVRLHDDVQAKIDVKVVATS